MCKECVKQPFPDRDRMCLDTGAFMANLKKCKQCSKMDLAVANKEKSDDEEEGKESVSYDHICLSCSHVICQHKYEFWVEEDRQEYRMDCLLCGFAEDSLSVMPYDPRKASAFHET